ncbi:hypothetical protein FRC02_006405 [Tulasnella sp. 418]|nr:hypothetical protein FRC02_006405 [Tulasnella sp. 418]
MTSSLLLHTSKQRIPTIALGTWQSLPGEVGPAVIAALKTGYRHIDGAWIYNNEVEVGAAIKESGIPRKDIFLTSKLWNSFHNPQHVSPHFQDTLSRLGVTYLDMYLMHWPVAFAVPPDGIPRPFPRDKKGRMLIDRELSEDFVTTWREMEKLVDEGKVKNIGVCNFSIGRLEKLLAHARIKPIVNQVEINYFFPQHEMVDWCKAQNILVEAYSPLGSSRNVGRLLRHPTIVKIADETQHTPAQVLLSWLHQRELIILPKSVHPDRIDSNFHIFELSREHFDLLQTESKKLETTGKTERSVDPSKSWGVPDIWTDDATSPAKM